jgi:hypothetical protein
MHDPELQELRRALARTITSRGIYYPDALRERVTAWAYARRDEGAPWDVIASELGCNNATLRRWVQVEGRRLRKKEPPSTALVAVEIVGDAPALRIDPSGDAVAIDAGADRAADVAVEGGREGREGSAAEGEEAARDDRADGTAKPDP